MLRCNDATTWLIDNEHNTILNRKYPVFYKTGQVYFIFISFKLLKPMNIARGLIFIIKMSQLWNAIRYE